MSVCVTIRTKKVVQPNVYLKSLADKGEQIVVTSNEYPSVKFGNHQKAIRGIEVNKEDNGLEVRVCSFSSTADYQLFAKTVDVLMEITGDKAYLENNEEEEITAPFEICKPLIVGRWWCGWCYPSRCRSRIAERVHEPWRLRDWSE